MKTKHITFFAAVFLVLLSFSVPLMAQRMGVRTPSTTPSTMIGVRGGLGIIGESVSPPFSGLALGTRAGFLGGGQLDYWMNDQWALSVQLLYDQKGASLSGVNESGLTETDDLALGYIEIPILAKVAFGTSNVRPYLFVGPSLGFLVSASTHQVVTSGGATVSDATFDETNTFNTVDLSLLFGAGASYQLSGGIQLFLDAGYALGILNTEKNASTGTSETINSRDIRIAAGAMFPLQ